MAALSLWFIGGSYLDGWAHIHIPRMETFFTPWHGVLYSGYLACAVFLVGAWLQNVLNGYPLERAIPAGYDLSVVGVMTFAVGGVGDFIWHSLFGIEADIEALLSPTHLILAISAALVVTGPLRAAWLRSKQKMGEAGLFSLLPAAKSGRFAPFPGVRRGRFPSPSRNSCWDHPLFPTSREVPFWKPDSVDNIKYTGDEPDARWVVFNGDNRYDRCRNANEVDLHVGYGWLFAELCLHTSNTI